MLAKVKEGMRILLVEDNPGDIRLAREAIKEAGLLIELDVVTDGQTALDFLEKKGDYRVEKTPNLILLDLNLPKVDGRMVLSEIKRNKQLRKIPVIIFTTSSSEDDIYMTYNLHANCYMVKPVEFNTFIEHIRILTQFWFELATIPPGKNGDDED